MKTPEDNFNYSVEQFADLQILRYRVHGFESLTLNQKKLIYYLSEAALNGRDILFDQNGKYNMKIRRLLEAVYLHYDGDRSDSEFLAFEEESLVLKRNSSSLFHRQIHSGIFCGFSS